MPSAATWKTAVDPMMFVRPAGCWTMDGGSCTKSLAGVLVAVGEGRIAPGEVRAILQNRARIPAVQTAPPQGLFLTKVFY